MSENRHSQISVTSEHSGDIPVQGNEQKKTRTNISRRNKSGHTSKIAWLEDENSDRKKSQIEVDNILNLLNEFDVDKEPEKSKISGETVESKTKCTDGSVENPLFFVPKESDSDKKDLESRSNKAKIICEDSPSKKESTSSAVFTDHRNSITSDDLNSDKMMQELDNIISNNIEKPKIDEAADDEKSVTKKVLDFDPLEGPPFKCAGCFQVIDDELCKTDASIWHPEHFNCVICRRSLIDDAFFEVDYDLYCELDYEIRFLKKCKACDNFIYDEMITIENQNYHPEHFVCAKCQTPLSDLPYFTHNDLITCESCYSNEYAPKCAGCGKAVMSNIMKVLGSTWHSNCFCCKTCQKPFSGGLFHIYGKDAYCELHYHEIRGTICFGCKKPITGTFVTACDRKFHPEHLVCSYCKKTLTGTSYKEFQGKPYCVSCSANLAS